MMGIWQNNQMIDKKKRLADSREKSLRKTISWRVIAVINSYAILLMAYTDKPLLNAVLMNLTGAGLYYIHERLWNKNQ